MSFIDLSDSFQCCLLLRDEQNRILLGTIKGKVYLGKLKSLDEIKSLEFTLKKTIPVLEECTEIFSLKGIIRAIEFLDAENILILTNQGEIINYNYIENIYIEIQNYQGTIYDRPWRLLVIDENNFITLGNFRKLKHWYKKDGYFYCKILREGGYPSFLLDWINLEEGDFIINGNDGFTAICNYKNNQFSFISNFISDTNLQKCIITKDNNVIAIDYYGTFYIYQKKQNSLDKIEEYSISMARGNWVQYSNEIKKFLMGTNDNLIIMNTNFDKIWKLDIECKQIIDLNNFDLILTSKYVVRPNYSKKYQPKEIHRYKYVKVGLVGDSRVGKTCFCKYLETEEFHDTKSSFGRHVWTIRLNGDKKRLLYYDLAGQGNELFTYFPMIRDTDIILLFYNGLLNESFDRIISYYNELKKNCPDAKFYFIQTYSNEDPDRLVKDWYITQEFEDIGINFEEQLIKIDSKNGMGFEDYQQKVVDKIEWESTIPVFKSSIYDRVENQINLFYNANVEFNTLQDLHELTNLNKRLLENIILFFKNQGMVEYIEDKKLIIINDEDYEKMHSLIAELIVGRFGFIKTKDIILNLGKTQKRLNYIDNILNYYRDNQIGIFFYEGEIEDEVIIIERKLRDKLRIPNNLKEKLPRTISTFYYKDIEIDLASFIRLLSSLPVKLISICNGEILLENKSNANLVLIRYNKTLQMDNDVVNSCNLIIDKRNEVDSKIEKKILKYFVESIADKFIDYVYTDNEVQKQIFENIDEELKFLLKRPFESPYLDFKSQLTLSNQKEKAEVIKDIIALTNSSRLNNNIAHLLVGFVEENHKIIEIQKVDFYRDLEQQISQICNEYLDLAPNIECIPIKINEIYNWQENSEISHLLPFNDNQKDPNNEDEFLFIKIKREPRNVCEVAKEIRYEKRGRKYFHRVGASWFRIGSHTFRLRDYHRVILRNK